MFLNSDEAVRLSDEDGQLEGPRPSDSLKVPHKLFQRDCRDLVFIEKNLCEIPKWFQANEAASNRLVNLFSLCQHAQDLMFPHERGPRLTRLFHKEEG